MNKLVMDRIPRWHHEFAAVDCQDGKTGGRPLPVWYWPHQLFLCKNPANQLRKFEYDGASPEVTRGIEFNEKDVLG